MLALLGPETIPIILLVAIVIFGGAKIPELARSLGRAKSEFRKGIDEGNAPEPAKSQAPEGRDANSSQS